MIKESLGRHFGHYQKTIVYNLNIMILAFRLLLLALLIGTVAADCNPNYEYADPTSGLCLPCDYNCLTCYDNAYCLECVTEYYLTSNNTCLKCSYGCSVCTSSSVCTTCNNGLFLTNAGSCSACGTGIATCTIAVIQSCQSSYFLLSTICAGCFSNCDTCADFVSCSSCALGYYLSPTASSCLACPSNCLICTAANTCTACQQGYTQSGGLCSPFSCSALDPFCIACTASQCLTCQQGKYLNAGNTCSQSGSLLCLESTGLYHTTCQTSNFGCPTYTYVQTDNNGNQLTVCLPKSATRTQEFIYIENSGYTCSGSCAQISTSQLTYLTSQAYYSIKYYLNIRFFGSTAIRALTIAFLSQNGSIATSSSPTVDVSKELAAFSDIDANCLGCKYSQTVVSGSVLLSQGSFETVIKITDGNGQFQVMQAVLQHEICQVAFCSSCTSAIDCYACFSPYFLELTSCVTACDSGFYIYGQVCYLQCPVGTFTVSSTYSCSACVAPCLTCSDATTCLTCVTGYFLEGSNCLTVCSSIYRFANSTSGNCETCPNPCITCAYQNNTMKCLSCAVGYLFNGSSCVFICPWGDYGFFLNGTSTCLGCSSACSSCYINSTVCSSCSAGFLLLSTDCLAISTCPSAYFTNATYNQCIACHFPCATCTALTTCTSCIRGSLYGSTCWNQCPTGYYSSYANPQNISCIACVSPCLACISITECRSCLTGFFLSQGNCLAVCPSDFYAQSSSQSCVGCVPPCKSCLNSTACLSCTTGYLDNTTCTLQCNSSAYVSSNFSCALCPTPCLACYAIDYCLSCSLPYFLYNHACISLSTCNNLTGYYPSYLPNASSPVSAVCSTCAFPCLACTNNSVTCATCQNGYYYVPNLYKCLTACPSTYYLSTATCLVCSNNCYQCSVTANNCTSCSAGMYLDPNSKICVGVCPSYYYANDQIQSCSACSSPCLTCYNTYLCSSCQTGILYEKQCISSCPAQTFLNTTDNSCLTCTNNCLTCANSSSLCLTCANGYFLLGQNCLSSCPSLYYSDEFMRMCQTCSVPCGSCTTATSCLSCVSGYYFFNSLCVSSCSSSYYADNTTSQCLSCNLTLCLTCISSANNCLTCNTNNGYYIYNQQCVNNCPSGTYADQVSGTCGLCPFPCSACLNYTVCTSCLSSYLLFSSRCFSQCPIAYYADNSSACHPCASDCQICTSATLCLECKTGFYVYNSSCLTSCPKSYYAGFASITNYDSCLACQANCLNCSSAEYCLVCSSGYMQFNGLCLTSCPILYYEVSGSNSYCGQCSQYCTSCVNSSYCLNCIGSYLYQHTCVTSCPAKTYPYQGLTCNPCKSPCENCSGDYTCLTCLSGYIYFHEYCVSSCPSDVWYYPSNNTCNVDCPYNKYAEKMICYVGSCGVSMVTLNGYCLQQCSSSYYVNSNQECTLCSQNNAQCNNLFIADLQILYIDVLTLVLYYNQRASLASIADVSVSFVDIKGNSISKNYSSYEITEYKVVLRYDYSAVSLVNVTLALPYVQSQEAPQCIATNQFKQELQVYHDYSSTVRPSLAILPMLLTGLLFLAVVVNMVNRASHFVQLLDFVQIVGVTLYLNVQYPPILEDFLAGFRLALFVVSENMINMVPYTFSPPKFIYYNVDTSIFRNSMPLLLVFLIVLVSFLVVLAVNAYNKERLVKAVRVIRYRLLNDLFSICLTPLLLFACQVLHEKPAAIFITALLGVVGVGYVVWISYKIVQVRKLSELEGLLGEFEKTESKLGLMYIPFGYVRRITLTLGLGLAPVSPISTLTLLLVCTFLIMICVYFYQPFDNHYTDYVTIFMQCSLTLYVVCLVILALQSLPAAATFALGAFVVGLVALTFILCLAWLVYLTIADIRAKGCWPSLKEEVNENAEDDYGDSKSEKLRKQQEKEKEESRRRKLGIQQPTPISVLPSNGHPPNEESANEFLNRYQSHTDELFSNANNEQFKHWSDEQGSRKGEEQMREGRERLPSLLLKKQIAGDGR